jgi:CheY-like chemotaxis protein
VVSEYAEEPAKILIVDDEYVNIYALTAMLSRLNLKCDSAHNGLEGLNKFKEHQYQVILMDVEMPLMNGIQAT